VLTVLRVRGIAVPDAARQRIVAEKDLEQLKRWHEKAITASSIAEVIEGAVAGERIWNPFSGAVGAAGPPVPAATPLPREAKTGGISRDEPGRRSRASLHGHCRSARWLRVSACAFRVQVPSAPQTK
jgi:hypothetical protein